MDNLYFTDSTPGGDDHGVQAMIADLRDEIIDTKKEKKRLKKKGGSKKKIKKLTRRIEKLEECLEQMIWAFKVMVQQKQQNPNKKSWAEMLVPQLIAHDPKYIEALKQPRHRYVTQASRRQPHGYYLPDIIQKD